MVILATRLPLLVPTGFCASLRPKRVLHDWASRHYGMGILGAMCYVIPTYCVLYDKDDMVGTRARRTESFSQLT
jgi:hypothetical protein